MGYCIWQMDASFKIRKENFDKVMDALRPFAHPDEHDDILDCFDNLGWQTDLDDCGNLTYVWYDNEKSYDEEEYLAAIAPYVESGSYISFGGDGDNYWRYRFRDGKMYTIPGRIVFDEGGDWEWQTTLDAHEATTSV